MQEARDTRRPDGRRTVGGRRTLWATRIARGFGRQNTVNGEKGVGPRVQRSGRDRRLSSVAAASLRVRVRVP